VVKEVSIYLAANEYAEIKDWRADWEWRPKTTHVKRCSMCNSEMREDWKIESEKGTLVSYVCPNLCMRENHFET
jgi:hypothetical protein